MLADGMKFGYAGKFSDSVHAPQASVIGILDFIANTLPSWRDDPERAGEDSEDMLSEQLSDFLSSKFHHSAGYDRFRTVREPIDNKKRNRKLDIAVKPNYDTVVDGKSHGKYCKIVGIECKRLPMPQPKNNERDEREYVIHEDSSKSRKSKGGIQRFKNGDHEGDREIAGMIGYVQDGTYSDWFATVNGWIEALASRADTNWNVGDKLITETSTDSDPFRAESKHDRPGDLKPITIKHMWIRMNDTNESAA